LVGSLFGKNFFGLTRRFRRDWGDPFRRIDIREAGEAIGAILEASPYSNRNVRALFDDYPH